MKINNNIDNLEDKIRIVEAMPADAKDIIEYCKIIGSETDNLMYGDDIPVDEFFNTMIIHGEDCVNSLFYNGVSATCLLNKNAEKFIEENKQCDILSNDTVADLNSKWMDNWKTLVDVKLLW